MNQVLPRILVLSFILLLGTFRSSAVQVVFSEVMYQPTGTKPEYIEITNITATPLDMARWTFINGLTYTFPDFNAGSSQAHFLRGNERIILSSANENVTRTAYPSIPVNVRVFGPWTSGSLSNSGERITLTDKNGVIVSDLEYADSGKWPVAPDGTGHSIVLTTDERDPSDWRWWRSSTNNGGSPGLADPALPAAGLALNEVHFNNLGQVDWIEVRNNSPTTTQPGTGLFLASTLNFSDKVPLSGNVTPGGVASFTVNFNTDNDGAIRLFLVDAANNVRDAVLITRRPGRDSWQVFPPGSREWYSDTTATQDAQNNPARNTDIVINEIMADPPSNERDGEFIELYNKGVAAVDISGWALDDDVNFRFPPGTSIPAGGYLVVAANSTWLNSQYAGLSAIGNWSGNLGNNGDRVRLEDANGNLADEVDFRFGGEWPSLAGGDGSSLELSNPSADNSLGSAWRDSDESTKSTFQSFTINGGTYAGTSPGGVDHELRIWTTGDSHMVLKNIVLRPTAGGSNVLVNGEVTTLANENITGWQSRGSHAPTFHNAEGVHLVADGGGDNKCNHMEKNATGLVNNGQYTLTFDARWIHGSARLVAQTFDLSWGGTVHLPIPNNLGTPGAQNSRFVANPPPQVTGLNHAPAVPQTNQLVTVTARVSSSSPLTGVQLWHRLDNAANNAVWNTTPMVDNGAGGDVRAGDGIYTAQINPAVSGYNTVGNIVQYYVQATTDTGATAELPRKGVEAPGLWVVNSAGSTADLRRMRVIITAYWGNAISQDLNPGGGHTATYNFKYPRLSNRFFPCVVIVNESSIYYDCGVHKTGSPFTRATNNSLDRGRVVFPGDNKFRNKSRFYWDNDGAGTSMLHNRIHRYWMYLLGVPANENEVCRVAKNNASFVARETNEVFDGDMLSRIYENGNRGYFHEMDDRFWIGDDGSTRLANQDGSWDYKSPDSQGSDNPTAYHNQFVPQSREEDYDFTPLLTWFQQLETVPVNQTALLERLADTQAMTAYAAVRGYSADWDNMTMSRGKNGYIYNRPTDNRWMMIHWDSDLSFDAGRAADPVIGGLANVKPYYDRPQIRRYLNHFLHQMITTYASNGPRIGAWLQAEENSSTAYTVWPGYLTWPTASNRHSVIQNFIGSQSLNAQFLTTFPANGATVTANTVSVTGTAPPNAFSIVCVGHPEAILTWIGTTGATPNTAPWNMSGILLRNGPNVLTFRMLDLQGAQVGSEITLTINKDGNAPPVAVLEVIPGSQNAEVGEAVLLNAGNSFDPELAGPLTYAWDITPATGYSVVAPSSSERILTFTVPGPYTVALTVTDANGQVSNTTRMLSIYGASGFDSFNTTGLSGYTTQNVEARDNSPGLAWYSLNEIDNNLVINITGVNPMTVRAGAPAFPVITRPLPSEADCSLQTDLTFETRKLGPAGTFMAGLYVETMESGILTQYVFGLDSGTTYRVWRASGGAAYTQIGTAAFGGGDITLRVLRSGNNLLFQRRGNGVWADVVSPAVSLPAGSTLVRGGMFASTGVVNSVLPAIVPPSIGLKVAFDYLLLSDPGSTSDLVSNLRITEIMYNPSGAGGVEFVELRNFGPAPLNLNGAYFEDSTPFSSRFTFGNTTLQPGQYCVVTNDVTAFNALYGGTILVAGQYTGSLNNDGEQIVLRDPLGNLIHDFIYGDLPPWPVTPDGDGPSLEASVTNPSLYGLGTSWRASYEIGGTPGFKGLAVDSDEDGFSDGIEIAYGSDPNAAGSSPMLPSTTRNPGNGHVTLTWASQNGRNYVIQYRDSLTVGAWQTLGNVTATGTTATFTDTTITTETQRFYRLNTEFP